MPRPVLDHWGMFGAQHEVRRRCARGKSGCLRLRFDGARARLWRHTVCEVEVKPTGQGVGIIA